MLFGKVVVHYTRNGLRRVCNPIQFRSWLTASFMGLLGKVPSLAHQSGNTEARAIADFLQQRALLRVLMRGSKIGYYPLKHPAVPPDEALFLAVAKRSDTWLMETDNPAQQFIAPGRYATLDGAYYTTTHSIYFPADSQVQELWQALTLLHEGSHAYDHLIYLRPKPPVWRGELRARRLEDEVVIGPKGAAFIKLLNTPVVQHEIGKALHAGEHLKLYEPSLAEISDAQLDQIFGTVISLDDTHYRRCVIGHCLVQHYVVTQGRWDTRLLCCAVG